MFGALGNILSAAVKVAVTPIAVVADAGKLITGETPDTTTGLLDSAIDDIKEI